MGILDDAIREHLELKRQHGAGSDDLDRLEKEAFGPPTRPGDPDFVDQDAGTTNGGEAAAAGAGEASPEAQPTAEPPGGTSEWLAGEDATTVLPQRESRRPEPSSEADRAEHPHLGEAADHPAPEGAPPATPEAPAGQPPAMAEPPPLNEPLPPAEPPSTIEPPGDTAAVPPEPPESSIFDADDVDFGDLDLELEDDDDDATLSPAREDVLRDRAVEEDTGNPPLPVPPREGDAADEDAEASPAEEPAGEDLLGETPEFLRDTPEDDRAWFEQDPPKDFDFDD